MNINLREIVLEMLLAVSVQKEYSHAILKDVLDKYNYLSGQEKAFIKRLFNGTIERQIEIDYLLNQFSQVKVNKMKPVIRMILRMGVYQILFMDAVPDSAACNEAVKLAVRKKFQSLKGFVNGVLRNIARNKDTLEYPKMESQPVDYLSIKYSMPKWIIERWLLQYSLEQVEKILSDFLEDHRVTIRINETYTESERKSVIEQLEREEVVVQQHPYLSYAFWIQKAEGIANLSGFQQGDFTVQDISSMLVGEIAKIASGYTVIDVCAAPGGKSLHVGTKLNHTGRVEARDVSEIKVKKIVENCERLHLDNIQVSVSDATVLEECSIKTADVVIADVPCSGLGVIGKKQDIKYNLTEEAISSIVSLQKEIITNAVQYVKEDGSLIYSTCTINKEENQEMVEWICKEFSFVLDPITELLPNELKSETTDQGYLQLLPGNHLSDGFFMARLIKEKD